MSGTVWIAAQLRDGALHPASLEAVAAGRQLAEALGVDVEAIVVGDGVGVAASQLARSGVRRVYVSDQPGLGDYVPGTHVQALVEAAEAYRPSYVVFPHTYQAVDHMARLAHRLDGGVLSEITSFASSEEGLLFSRPILEGKMQAKTRICGLGPMVLSVQTGAFQPAEATSDEPAPIERLEAAKLPAPERELLGIEDAGGEKIDLTAADLIVSVGRGIGGPEKMAVIEELAAALGAEIGASRPVIDSGWLPRDRQIGSSGQTVAPKLYIAIGISGAIQHLVGMKGAACTVAINKDAGAPIYSVADYGIVGDLFEVVPALTAALKEASSD